METLITRYGSAPESRVRERALRALIDALDDQSQDVRRTAANTFFMLGPKAKPVVNDLDRALDGPDKPLRVVLAHALLKIDPDATRGRVIAVMSSMCADQSVAMRFGHYRLLRVLVAAQGEDRTAALLVPLLKHPDRATRMQAVHDLVAHCPGAAALRPALLEALSSEDGSIRAEAALFFLSREPGMASRALDTLAEQIADPLEGSYIYWDLVKKTRNASPTSMTPLAARLLDRLERKSTAGPRETIIPALGEIGPQAIAAVPVLLKSATAKDPELASRSAAALVKIDPRTAATMLPSLLDWITASHDPTVRHRAMKSLGDLGRGAASAMPALLTIADEQDLAISAAAFEAISKIDPEMGRTLKQSIARGELLEQDRAASAARID